MTLVWLFLSVLVNGQKDSTITLHADTSDKYILVYKADNFNILMGYNAFTKSKILDSGYIKGSTLKYIDSMKKCRNTIYLNSDSICSDSIMMHDFGKWDRLRNIFQETQSVISNLIDSGNVIIFDPKNKKRLSVLVKKKKNWKRHSSWGYGYEAKKGESWFYTDRGSHKLVFESLIYMRENIKENIHN